MNLNPKQRREAIEGARRYAAADKSDPFAFNRAMTHINNGLCGIDENGRVIGYDADEAKETRYLPNGEAYEATVWKNRRRI